MKRVPYIIAACVLAVTCSGCAPMQAVLDQTIGEEYTAEMESIPHIGFSNGDVTATTNIITVEEFDALPIEYDRYRGSFFYDQLNGADEQRLYHAFEYALENGYQNVLFDDSLISDTDRLQDLLTFLSLDSPLLEQNVSYELGSFTTHYPIEVNNFYTTNACFKGYYMTVKNFDMGFWEKKLEAIKKADEVIKSLAFSDQTDERHRAEAIYRYIGQTVSYEEYKYPKDDDVYPYLYDTLVSGHSHCDGFANAISLLLNMADVNGVEKQCRKVDGGDAGHTWNYACLNGVWYNIDGTYIDWIPTNRNDALLGPGFGFSDIFQQGIPDYADYYSEGTEDYAVTPDAHVATVSDPDFIDKATAGYTAHAMQWAYIVVDSCDKDVLKQQMQEIANAVHSRVYYASFPIMNQRTAVYIYNGDLYNK